MAQNLTPLTGVDADAGAQPSVSSGGRVPYGGFGPSPTPTSQAALGVFAPLDVQGASPQTKFLAQRLQESLQQMHYPAMEAERADARKAEEAGESEGAAAATIGKVDPKVAAANSAYQIGASRVIAQQHAQQAVVGALQQFSDPKSGWANLPLEDSHPGAGDGLASKVDQFFAQQLGGLEKDPITAAAIAPIVEHGQNEILGQAYKAKITRQQELSVQNAVSLAAAQASAAGTVTTGKVFDYDKALADVKAAYLGDGVQAMDALSQGLIDEAVALHNPHILDLIKAAPGQPTLAPELQAKIAEARQRVNVLLTKDYHTAQAQTQSTIMSMILQNKDPRAALLKYLQMPQADPKFAASAMGFYHSMLSQETSPTSPEAGAVSSELTSGIASGQITTAGQALDVVNHSGLQGAAKAEVLTHALSAIHSVQSTNQDDPYLRSGITYLNQYYKPATNPINGAILNEASVPQHAGALMDFHVETQKLIKQGKSPEEATTLALQNIEKKWGKPHDSIDQTGGKSALPETDEDQAQVIANARKNPQALLASGITSADLQRLTEVGLITLAQGEYAQNALLAVRHHK